MSQKEMIKLDFEEQLISVSQLKANSTPIKKKDSITHEVIQLLMRYL